MDLILGKRITFKSKDTILSGIVYDKILVQYLDTSITKYLVQTEYQINNDEHNVKTIIKDVVIIFPSEVKSIL